MKTFTDAAMAVVLIVFAVSSFRRGLVRSLVDLVGGLASLVAAVYFAQNFAVWARGFLGPSAPKWMADPVLSKAAAVLLLFLLFETLIQTAASLLDHVFRLPGLRQVNALFGGFLGFGKGGVVVLLLCAVLRVSLPSFTADVPWLRQAAFSQIYRSVAGHNPVYDLLQSEFWNEVGKNAKTAV